MRVLLIGDFRSALARGWVQALPPAVTEVILLSTRQAQVVVDPRVISFTCSNDPVSRAKAFFAANRQAAGSVVRQLSTPRAPRLPRIAAEVVSARATARRARRLIDAYQPNLVHALRIPYEGIAGAFAVGDRTIPLALSIWGNDLTLHAKQSRWVGRLTRRALQRTNGLHADCLRDARLATEWGLKGAIPVLVAPTNGGLDDGVFNPDTPDWSRLRSLGLDDDRPIVVNPRGLRAYVRTDVFFHAVDLVRREIPDVLGVAVGVAGHAPSEQLIGRLALGNHVVLLPTITQDLLADVFRAACVSVSPATHDGTPNSLLEAMACGAFPVVSDLTSTREWVDDARNGLLFDPMDAEDLASRLVHAIRHEELRRAACESNVRLVEERATRSRCTARIGEWYDAVIAGRP